MKAVFSVMNGEPGRSAWMPLALALLALACFSSAPAFGQANWNGSSDDNWFNAGNWSGGVPTSSTDAFIDSITNNPVLIGGAPPMSTIWALGARPTG